MVEAASEAGLVLDTDDFPVNLHREVGVCFVNLELGCSSCSELVPGVALAELSLASVRNSNIYFLLDLLNFLVIGKAEGFVWLLTLEEDVDLSLSSKVLTDGLQSVAEISLVGN